MPLFYKIYIYIKHPFQCKLPLHLKKAGLASRNIVHKIKSFYVVSVSAFKFVILCVKPIRSLVIQRIPCSRIIVHGCLLEHVIIVLLRYIYLISSPLNNELF